MKILKHKNIEFSEVLLSELDEDMRIDPEYYQPMFIEKYNKISNHKNIYKLNKLAVITDGEHGSPDLDENSGIKYLSGHNIKDNFIEFSDIRYCSYQLHNKNLRSSITKGNVLLSIVGTVGNASVIHNQFLGNTDRNVATIKNIDSCLNPYYLSTFLNSTYGKFQTERFSTGNVQALLNLLQIKKIIIPIPYDTLQKAIQKLIEEALKQKELSEKLYKEAEQILLSELGLENWKPKTKKFKLHGVEFEVEDTVNNINSIEIFRTDRIDSEYFENHYYEIIEHIQKYEAFDYLKNVCNIYETLTLPDKDKLYKYIELSDIATNGIINGYTEEIGKYLPTRARRLAKSNQVLISSIEGSLSSCALIPDELDNSLCSTGFYLLDSKRINSETLLILFKTKPFQALLKKTCSGTILTAISRRFFKNLIIPIIDITIQKKIKKKVDELMYSNKKSKSLLEISKRAVEIFIEENEEKAMEYINNNKTIFE